MKRLLFILSGTMFAWWTPLNAMQINTEDYSYIQKLELEPGHAIYELDIPASLYKSGGASDMDSVMILKTNGDPITFSLLKAEVKKEEKQQQISLPFFELQGNSNTALDELVLEVERDSNRTMINVRSSGSSAKQGKTRIGYLIDLQKLENRSAELVFQWSQASSAFVTELDISASDDLLKWRSAGTDGVLADMKLGTSSLHINTVKLSQTAGKYLRIGWKPDQHMPEISSVSAVYTTQQIHSSRSWHELVPVKTGKADFYEFQLPGWMPVDQVKLSLPEDNSAARVRLSSRNDSKQPWRHRGGGLVYRLSVSGRAVSNDIVNISQSRDRYWQLHIADAELAIGSGVPVVKVAWQPERLRFLARGSTEYVLAVSRKKQPASGRSSGSLLSEINSGSQAGISPAKAVPADILKQADWLEDGDTGEKKDIRSVVLWLVLLLGVALLGFMAIQLHRQTRETKD